MLIPRRISDKKCRFTAKKITFLEYQRIKRSELTKNITERKRLGSILFLPEVSDELNYLSHESVQRILHQGSLFHSVTTKLNGVDTLPNNHVNFNQLLGTIENPTKIDDGQDSLHDLLYGRIFNVRCLNNHDLCLLLTYLVDVSEFSDIDSSLLLRVLTQINFTFETLSISEISHILYCITKLEDLKTNFAPFTEITLQISSNTLKFLSTPESVNDLNFNSPSSISKLLYSLTFSKSLSVFYTSNFKLMSEELLSVYLKAYETGPIHSRTDSRDFSLICKSMVKLKLCNYELLSLFSDYYHHQLEAFNSIISEFDKSLELSGLENVSTNLNHNMEKLNFLERVDEKINLGHLFDLLDASEYFGFNHRKLLEALNEYISSYLRLFLTDCTFIKNYFNIYTINRNARRNKLVSLLKNNNYFKNNKLNLQKIYSEVPKVDQTNQFLDPEIISRMQKYVSKRFLFQKFVEEASKYVEVKLPEESIQGSNCPDGSYDEPELIEKFMESTKQLPRVLNFNNIWKVLKLINVEKRTFIIPMAYSYLQESSIIFEELEGPSEDLFGIFRNILENKCQNHLVVIDNFSKIVQMFIEADLKRDYVGLVMFSNMFKILNESYKITPEQFEDLNQCGSISFLREILEDYFKSYKKRKILEFSEIPERKELESMFEYLTKGQVLGDGEKCAEVEVGKMMENMIYVLDSLGDLDENVKKVVDLNEDVFKFVIYNGFMAQMAK
ncbi:hypothetical protein TpMuguga_03g00143 [Theileria parva strain Muguga]|uniref:Uncharacterized protein n=1 Tax=Theileria parva TaxID=5875 RepID=Q4N0J3_THEPA|nr:uncharacterized protein TpMuguga_03g00143 [Theileria parva strain Muguga]EAN30878.1 hypothetical protein TpMuguga_03g00143 [Theileria parva strain Muguga]|eukprot:XP_763161.1 hypothetical protein [Theileria parva strain Muguga]